MTPEKARLPPFSLWWLTALSIYSALTIADQSARVRDLRASLPKDPALFKKTYKSTFLLARNAGQKVLAFETAIEYWRLLLDSPGGYQWSSATTPWLSWWIEFLEGPWSGKAVNKDMWDQTGVFVDKCKGEDGEKMGWWNEEGAWPGVIDEFVAFVKAKRGEGKGEGGEEMEIG